MSASLARQLREHKADVRNRIAKLEPSFISPEDPRLKNAKQVTHAYALRQLDQSEALLGTVSQMAGKHALLVRKDNRVAVWVSKAPIPAPQETENAFEDGLALFRILA